MEKNMERKMEARTIQGLFIGFRVSRSPLQAKLEILLGGARIRIIVFGVYIGPPYVWKLAGKTDWSLHSPGDYVRIIHANRARQADM